MFLFHKEEKNEKKIPSCQRKHYRIINLSQTFQSFFLLLVLLFCFCCSGQLLLAIFSRHTLDKYKSLAIVRTRSAMSSLHRQFVVHSKYLTWNDLLSIHHHQKSTLQIVFLLSRSIVSSVLVVVVCCSCKIHFRWACDVCVSCF